MEDVKRKVDNLPLYNYIFEGDTSKLKPEDIFRSTNLLSLSVQLFEEKAFTSDVVAEGISYIATPEEIERMFKHPKNSFTVNYRGLVMGL